MTPQEKLVQTLMAEVGYKANSGKRSKYAAELDAIGYIYNYPKNGYDWCDVFADWAYIHTFGIETAIQMIYQPKNGCGAGCPFSAQYYKNNNAWSSTPSVGAQIFFGSRGNEYHTGIVVDFDDTYVYCVEGNVGGGDGAVKYLTRPRYSGISGYGIPKWSLAQDYEEDIEKSTVKKTTAQLVEEVLAGKWGSGDTRKTKLTLAGYDYNTVQSAVNEKLKAASKVNTEVSPYAKGIDISTYQKNVDFNKVKNDGISFVILREGYGQNTDGEFFTHVKGAAAAGLAIPAVYHFCYSVTEAGAVEEAKLCLENVKKAGLGKDTIIFMDFEYDTVTKARNKGVVLGKNECIKFTRAFCDYVQNMGYRAGAYYNLDYYRNMYDSDTLNRYVKWFALYNGGARPSYDCVYHQYSSSGSVSGIYGNVDMNIYYGGESVKPLPSNNKEPEKATEDTTKKVQTAASFNKEYAGEYTVSSSIGLHFRYGPSTDYDAIATIPDKATVTCQGYYTGNWLYVTYNNKVGYCYKGYLKKKEDEINTSGIPSKEVKWTGKVTAGELNVRTWAGMNYKAFTYITRGTKVEVCDTLKANDGSKWYYIHFNGKYGFVSAQYIDRD